MLSLVYYLYLPRAEFSSGLEWAAGIVLLVEVQAGGLGFLRAHGPRRRGPSLARHASHETGAVLIAVALISLAVGLAANL